MFSVDLSQLERAALTLATTLRIAPVTAWGIVIAATLAYGPKRDLRSDHNWWQVHRG